MAILSRKITKPGATIKPERIALYRAGRPCAIGAPLLPKPPKPVPAAYKPNRHRRGWRPVLTAKAPARRGAPNKGVEITRGGFGSYIAIARDGGRLYELHPTKGWRSTRDQVRWSGP
jgi:hypothetical protein